MKRREEFDSTNSSKKDSREVVKECLQVLHGIHCCRHVDIAALSTLACTKAPVDGQAHIRIRQNKAKEYHLRSLVVSPFASQETAL